jgi:head-tail adaptor
MLTAADLSFMRDTQEDALPGTVVIQRHTLVSDGMGGATETWAAVGTAIGRIYPRRTQSAENIGGGQVHSHMQWWATFPVGTQVDAGDRLVYSDRSWEVIGTNNDEMWQSAVRCELTSHNEELRT